ncbi:MAG: hypothetical protein AAGH79_14505 [Bacteroidota bacterium]
MIMLKFNRCIVILVCGICLSACSGLGGSECSHFYKVDQPTGEEPMLIQWQENRLNLYSPRIGSFDYVSSQGFCETPATITSPLATGEGRLEKVEGRIRINWPNGNVMNLKPITYEEGNRLLRAYYASQGQKEIELPRIFEE